MIFRRDKEGVREKKEEVGMIEGWLCVDSSWEKYPIVWEVVVVE